MSTLTLKNNTNNTLIKNQKSIQSKPIVGTFVWIGGASTSWSTPSNWLGGVVPGVNDTAYFDGHRSVRNCDIDIAANVKGIRIQNFYSGTITQGDGNILIGSDGWYQDGGVFNGNINVIVTRIFRITNATNAFIMDGGTFNSPIFLEIRKNTDVGGLITNFTVSSNSVFNGRTSEFPAGTTEMSFSVGSSLTANINSSNVEVDILTIKCVANANISINGTITAKGLLYLTGQSASGTNQMFGGTIKCEGDIIVDSITLNTTQGVVGNYSTTIIEMTGAGNQTITFSSRCGYNGKLPGVLVNKPSGTLVLDPSYPINVLPSWNVVSCPSLSATGSTLRVFKKFYLDDYQSFEASTPLEYNNVEFYTVGTKSFYLTSNLTCNNWYGDNKNSQYGGGCIRSVAGQKIYVKGNHTLALTNGGGGAGYTGFSSNTINDETVFQMIGDGTSSTKTLYGSTSGNCITALEINNPTGTTLISGNACIMGGIKQLNGALNFSTDSTVTITSIYSRLRYVYAPSATFQNLNIYGAGGVGGASPGIYISGGNLNVAKNLSVDSITSYGSIVSGDLVNVSGNIYMGQYLTNITNQINHVGTTTATISHNNSSANKITGLINKIGSGSLYQTSNLSRFNNITISNGTYDFNSLSTVIGVFTQNGGVVNLGNQTLKVDKLILSGGTFNQGSSANVWLYNSSYGLGTGVLSNSIINNLNIDCNTTLSVSGDVVTSGLLTYNQLNDTNGIGRMVALGNIQYGITLHSSPFDIPLVVSGNTQQVFYTPVLSTTYSAPSIIINQQPSGSFNVSGIFDVYSGLSALNAPSFNHTGKIIFSKGASTIAASSIVFDNIDIFSNGDVTLAQSVNNTGTLTFGSTLNSLNGGSTYGKTDFNCYGNVILQKAANNNYPTGGGNVNLVMCGNNKDQYITYTQANSAIGPGDLIINHSGSGQVYLSGGDGYVNNLFRTQSLILSSGTFNLSGNNIYVNGNIQFSGGNLVETNNKTINVASGWVMNTGTFTPSSSGLVNLYGLNQSVKGSTTFAGLKKAVTTSRTLTFDASSTTTVSGALTLSGASGQPLLLRSSSTGTQWKIAPNGTRNIGFLNVQDSNNLVPPNLVPSGSVNNGNNTGWF